MQIKQLVPTTDWFWVGTSFDNKPIVQPVAVWAVVTTDEGDRVIGMIGAVTNASNPEAPRLVMPPDRVVGGYKHKSELTSEEASTI